MLPDPLTEAREAAHVAYVEAVKLGIHPLDRVNLVFETIMISLRAHGLLGDGKPQPTLDDMARTLAQASGLPRYSDGDGWKLLRRYGSEITVAYLKAVERLRPGQERLAIDLALTQERLLEGLEGSTP